MLRQEGLPTTSAERAETIMASWRAQVGDREIAAVRRDDGWPALSCAQAPA